jgi:ATP-dependent DNA ligase
MNARFSAIAKELEYQPPETVIDGEITALKPMSIAEMEFTEWTPDERLRHASFVGLRDDKKAQRVVRET